MTLWAVLIVGLLGVLLLFAPEEEAGPADVLWPVGMAALGTVGALVASRVPGNPIGWAFLGVAVFTIATAWLAEAPLSYQFAEWLGHWTWIPAVTVPTTFCLLLFPDGRLPSRRWRPVAWAAAIGIPAFVGWMAFGSDLGGDPQFGPNPYHLPALSAVFGWLSILIVVAVFGSVAAVIARFRRSREVERQQMKWVALGGLLAFLTLVAVSVLSAVSGLPAVIADAAILAGITLIPVSVAVAILRYRLYDIDRLISRTVAYALVVALVAGAYTVVALSLATILGPREPVAVAASTLVAAALFNPARRRVLLAVERRFNRSRYDAQTTLADFSRWVRNEVDLAALSSGLCTVVADSLQPAHLSMWLSDRGRPSQTLPR